MEFLLWRQAETQRLSGQLKNAVIGYDQLLAQCALTRKESLATEKAAASDKVKDKEVQGATPEKGASASESPFQAAAFYHRADFTFVANAVQANILASLTQNVAAIGQVFNVACGDRTSLNELYMILQRLANSELQPNYGHSREGDIQDSLADITKIETLLAYKPSIRIEEGLKLTLAWFGK